MLLPALSKLHLKEGFTPRRKNGASTEWGVYYSEAQPQYLSEDEKNNIIDVGTDGNCLYYALYSLFYDKNSENTLEEAMDIRKRLADYILTNIKWYVTDDAETFSEMKVYVIQNVEERPIKISNEQIVQLYARLLYNPEQENNKQKNMWGGDVEIRVAANVFGIAIHRYAHNTYEANHTNDNLIIQFTAHPDLSIVPSSRLRDGEPWQIIRIGVTGLNEIKPKVAMGEEYSGHFMYVLPKHRRMNVDSGDGSFSSSSANKRLSGEANQADKKPKTTTEDSGVEITHAVDDTEDVEIEITHAVDDTKTYTKEELSEYFESIGFRRVKIERKGDCYPLSVMAGHEIKDEAELLDPTQETTNKVTTLRNNAINLVTTKNQTLDGFNPKKNMRISKLFTDWKQAQKQMAPWKQEKFYGTTQEQQPFSYFFHAAIAMHLRRKVVMIPRSLQKEKKDQFSNVLPILGKIKDGVHKETKLTVPQLIELLKKEDDISVIEHNGINHYDAWIRDFSNTNQVNVMYDILTKKDLTYMSISDKENHLNKIVSQIQLLSDTINTKSKS